MASLASYRVKIPRSAQEGKPAASPETGESRLPEVDLPGTFITAMPALSEEGAKVIEIRPVNPPYSYSRITYNDRTKEYIYEAIEPQLSTHERELLDHLKDTMGKVIGAEVATLTSGDKRAYLRGVVEEFLKTRGIQLSPLSTERLVYYIQRDFVGYGPVDTLILDPNIEDISCDGVEDVGTQARNP